MAEKGFNALHTEGHPRNYDTHTVFHRCSELKLRERQETISEMCDSGAEMF